MKGLNAKWITLQLFIKFKLNLSKHGKMVMNQRENCKYEMVHKHMYYKYWLPRDFLVILCKLPTRYLSLILRFSLKKS